MVFGLIVYAVAWVRGAGPERTGAGVLLLACLLSEITYRWEVDGHYPAGMVQDCVRLLIFAWMSFRLDRWWLLVMTAANGLLVLVYVLRLVDPAVSQYTLASAHVGLGYLIDLTLLFGVGERWLAGERAAAPAAWAKANRATAARDAARWRGDNDAAQAHIAATPGPAGRSAGPPTIGDSG